MKLYAVLAIALILFTSCSRYQYTFKMTKPVENTDLSYENDTLSLKLVPYNQAFFIQVKNKLNVPVKILWDDVSMAFLNNTIRKH
jgi:hypothetical protein